MSSSENPDSHKESAEKISTDSDELMDLESILNEGKSSSVENTPPKPYIPEMENEDTPPNADEKWERLKNFPDNLLDEEIPTVQVTPEPEQLEETSEPEIQTPANKQYIPGMDVAPTSKTENKKTETKKTASNNTARTILLVILLLGGGGYLGYMGYQNYWKPSEDVQTQAAASETAGDAGQIRLTKVQAGNGIRTKTSTDAEDVKIKTAAPKPTEEQVRQARANIMGFFEKAKAVVASQNSRLQETISNAGILKDSAAPENTTGQDSTSAAGDKTAGQAGEASSKFAKPNLEADNSPTYVPAPEGFTLTGTMNLDGNRLAFVNDTVVTVGKEINGATVVQIGHRWVELKKDNQLFRLNMD